MKNETTHCGYVAVVGRPNVGKSTLLNCILGTKLCITSDKPQTTRHRLLGIKTHQEDQFVYVDTPGIHKKAKVALNRYLNKAALTTFQSVDVIVLVVDCTQWEEDDNWVLKHLKNVEVPVILAVNKIDRLKDRTKLLPLLEAYQKEYKFAAIIPVSAMKGDQVQQLEDEIKKYLPESPFFFPEDQISDRGDQFIAAEIVREKLMRNLEQELPYSITVTIDAFADEKDIVRISAVIWVERDSHKPIVIGKKGDQLKKIGKLARVSLEQYFHKKVYIQLWVKVKTGWTDDENLLSRFGYEK